VLYGVTFAIYYVLAAVFGSESDVPFFGTLPLCLVWAVVVWRCAMNGVSKAVGIYLRACIVTGAIGMLVLLLMDRW
jgi:ABC-type long-subunit fatty acid transport system fused permease/ATPase subunit